MHAQYPPVIRLEYQNSILNITYLDDEKMSHITAINKLTKLTAWCKLNQDDLDANKYLYCEILKYYIWKSDKQLWKKRKKE